MTFPGAFGIKDGRGWGPYGTGYVKHGNVELPLGPHGEVLGPEYDFQPGPGGGYLPSRPPLLTVGPLQSAKVGDTPEPRWAAMRRAVRAVMNFRDRVKARFYVYAETGSEIGTTAHDTRDGAFAFARDRETVPGENYVAVFDIGDSAWPDPVYSRYRAPSAPPSEVAVSGPVTSPSQVLRGRFRVVVRDGAQVVPVYASDDLAMAHRALHSLEHQSPAFAAIANTAVIFDSLTGRNIATAQQQMQPADPYAGPAPARPAPARVSPTDPMPPENKPGQGVGMSPVRYQIALNHQTDLAFWNETKHRPGKRLDPKDPADQKMIPKWIEIRTRIARTMSPADLQRAEAISKVTDLYLEQPAPFFVYAANPVDANVYVLRTRDEAYKRQIQMLTTSTYVASFSPDTPEWPGPFLEQYPGGEIEIDPPPSPNVSGESPVMNSTDPWLPFLRNASPMIGAVPDTRPSLVKAVAPVLAPATGPITASLRLDGNQVLHASVCVDGRCYSGSANLAPLIAAVSQQLAAWHRAQHALPGPAGTPPQGVPQLPDDFDRPPQASVGHRPGGGGGFRHGGYHNHQRWGHRRPRWQGGNWGAGYTYVVPAYWEDPYAQPGPDVEQYIDQQNVFMPYPGTGEQFPTEEQQQDTVASGVVATLVGADPRLDAAVRLAGDELVGNLVDHHIGVVCAGWWDDVTGVVKKAAGGVADMMKATVKHLKVPIQAATAAAATAIPGVGPLVAPLAANLSGALVDAAMGDPQAKQKAEAVLAQAKQAALTDPRVKEALDLAHKTAAKTTAAAQLSTTAQQAQAGDPNAQAAVQQTAQAAQQGDPAAQKAMSVMDRAMAEFNKALGAEFGGGPAVQGWTDFVPGYNAVRDIFGGAPRGHGHHHRHHHHHRHGHVRAAGDVVGIEPMTLAALALGVGGFNFYNHLKTNERLAAAHIGFDPLIPLAVTSALLAANGWAHGRDIRDIKGRLEAAHIAGDVTPLVGTGGPVFAQLVGAAVSTVRAEASRAAQEAAAQGKGPAIGFVRTSSGPSLLTFASSDDADDWFGALDPRSYIYAAYYDTTDASFPGPLNEATGKVVPAAPAGAPIQRGPATVGHWMIPLALGTAAGAGGVYAYEHRDAIKKWLLGT